MSERFIKQLLENQKLMDKDIVEDNINNVEDRILSFSRNNIGIISLEDEVRDGNLTPITDGSKMFNILGFLDNVTGLVYRFKYNATSGGRLMGRKELYETLISRMVNKFGKAVQYYPAEIDGERGVLSLDWRNGNNFYGVLNAEYEFESLAEIDYRKDLEEDFTKKALTMLKKVPQQFKVGNSDYVTRNIAYKRRGEKISELMFYDFGYSAFSRVESYLEKMNLEPNSKNIKEAYLINIWGFINSSVGMGATKNLMKYEEFKDIIKDFCFYSRYNSEFFKNVKESMKIDDKAFLEEIRKLKYDGFKFFDDNERIVRKINEINTKNFQNCL